MSWSGAMSAITLSLLCVTTSMKELDKCPSNVDSGQVNGYEYNDYLA